MQGWERCSAAKLTITNAVVSQQAFPGTGKNLYRSSTEVHGKKATKSCFLYWDIPAACSKGNSTVTYLPSRRCPALPKMQCRRAWPWNASAWLAFAPVVESVSRRMARTRERDRETGDRMVRLGGRQDQLKSDKGTSQTATLQVGQWTTNGCNRRVTATWLRSWGFLKVDDYNVVWGPWCSMGEFRAMWVISWKAERKTGNR